jgi:hypothetical protein
MRSVVAKLLLTVILAVLAVFAAFAAYDLVVFQPRRPQIEALLSRAAPEERTTPPALAALLRASLHGGTAAHSAQLLVRELAVPRLGSGAAGWHLTTILWQTCMALHVPSSEQLALIAARAPMGRQMKGFAAAADAYFSKPLSSLDREQLTFLVAVSKSPSRFEAVVPAAPRR